MTSGQCLTKDCDNSCQSMDGSGGNAWLPPEGMHAAASLFSLIAESELKGSNFRTVDPYIWNCFLFSNLFTS